MYIKNALIFIFLLISSTLFSQITVDDVGDGWKSKVDSALVLIEKTSPEHWSEVKQYCSHITFWIGQFSTTTDTSTIMISTRDIRIGSINNLACLIVHESRHLRIKKENIEMSVNKEELECYLWEDKFLKKIEYPEPWLVRHVIKCIIHYQSVID